MLLLLGRLDEAREAMGAALGLTSDDAERAEVLRHCGNLGTELADRELAIGSFRQAVQLLTDGPQRAVVWGELAMAHLHFAEHEAAEEGLVRALDGLSEHPYFRAHMLVSRAVLRLDQERWDDADRDLAAGLAIAEHLDHRYARGYANAVVGLGRILRGEVEAARQPLLAARDDVAGFGLLELRVAMRLAGVAAWLGDVAALETHGVEVRKRWGADGTAVDVFGLYEALGDLVRGDVAAVLARLEQGDEVLDLDEEARGLRRLLLRHLPGEDVLRVGPEGQWFELAGHRCDLARHGAARRLLVCLSQNRDVQPADVLFAAGWPGEHIQPDSARNRLRVELARLRRLGLRPHLQTERGGWRLDPELAVVPAA